MFGTVDELRLEMEWLGTFLRAPSTGESHHGFNPQANYYWQLACNFTRSDDRRHYIWRLEYAFGKNDLAAKNSNECWRFQVQLPNQMTI